MKRNIYFLLSIILFVFFAVSCQDDNENATLSEQDLEAAENEAEIESIFDDIDDIGYEAAFYANTDGRIAADEESSVFCATVTVDLENKTIIIDYGDGCVGKDGRERAGKIIITYTDWCFVPGSVHTLTFEDFYVDGIKIEGTRTKTNISENPQDTLKFQVELKDGKIIWEDSTFATREASWTTTRIRTLNPINDIRIREGSASGVTREGLPYSIVITKPIVWLRGCLPNKRVFIPVEGTKVITVGDDITIIIDYGDGTCDNIFTVTKNGIAKEIEFKKHKRNG